MRAVTHRLILGLRPTLLLVGSLVGCAATLLAGCASMPSPVEQLAASQAAVRAAEEAGADKLDPQAQLYLKLARENLDKGKSLMDAEDFERADRSLRKSEADAELARGLARKKAAQDAVEEAKKTLSKLKPVTQ